MTPDEHEQIRALAEVRALRTMLTIAAIQLRSALPADPQGKASCIAAIASIMTDVSAQNEQLTIPKVSAAESNLAADLYREAFDDAAKAFIADLSR